MRRVNSSEPPLVSAATLSSAMAAICLVLPFLRLPLGEGDLGVAHAGTIPVEGQIDVLEPLVVVALGVVGAELGAARLLALDRRLDDALGAVEHVAELDGAEDVLVEDRAAIVDVGGRGLFLEALDD